jgi:sulfite reductase (ferredoxin)
LIHRLNEGLVSTLAACGDVVRNVVCCPAHLPGRKQDEIMATAQSLSRYFKPRSRAYYELWIDGEKAVTAGVPEGEEEPIYGDAYLPRKFKIGLAFPGDNCIDVYSQDLGFIPIDGGFDVVVGGGMGQSHAREDDTYPRLASPLVWIEPEDLAAVAEAVIGIHRDFGNREDRQQARLKYVVDRLGSEWFRAEVERRVGHPLADYVPLPAWDTADHLGWWQDATRRWTLGVPVPNGRIRGELKAALRAVVEHWKPEVRLTTRQDILLCGFTAAQKADVDGVLAEHGVRQVDELRPLDRFAMACPALPTCGQALGESERVMPELLDGIHAVLDGAGLSDLPVHLNMTGCPNGCARPYSGDIGIVGRVPGYYSLYVGGDFAGTRLNAPLADRLDIAGIAETLDPLFELFAGTRRGSEGFGDFCHRIGIDALRRALDDRLPGAA